MHATVALEGAVRRPRPSAEAVAAIAVARDAQAGNQGVCDLACQLTDRVERALPHAERYAQVLADALTDGVPPLRP